MVIRVVFSREKYIWTASQKIKFIKLFVKSIFLGYTNHKMKGLE